MEIRPTLPSYRRATDDSPAEKLAPEPGEQAEKPGKQDDGVAGGPIQKLGESVVEKLRGASEATTSGSGLPAGETPAEKAAANRAAGSREGRPVNADDFAREARIRATLGGAPTAPEGRFGSKDGGSLTAGARELPAPGLGKNHVSRDGQRSADADAKANTDADAKTKTPPEHWSAPVLEFVRVLGLFWRGITTPAVDPDDPTTHNAVSSTRGTPDPNKEVGVRDAAFDLHHRPTVGDAIRDRDRQVGQPGEGSARERVFAPHDVAVKEGMRRPTDGRITPADGDGTVGGEHTGTPGPDSGIEKVDGTRPGDPKRPGDGEV